jgi:hypothetical protein
MEIMSSVGRGKLNFQAESEEPQYYQLSVDVSDPYQDPSSGQEAWD